MAWAQESWHRHGRPLDGQLTEEIETLERHLETLPTASDQRELVELVNRRLDDLADRLDLERPTGRLDLVPPRQELGLRL